MTQADLLNVAYLVVGILLIVVTTLDVPKVAASRWSLVVGYGVGIVFLLAVNYSAL